jgi:hypothetical protein
MSRLYARKAGESRPGEPADPTADTAVLPASELPRESAGEMPVSESATEAPVGGEPAADGPAPVAETAVEHEPATASVAPPANGNGTNGHTAETEDAPESLTAEEEVPDRPGFRDRARVRRRARYLRKVHEVQLRDLGGLVFDLTRFGRDRPDLVQEKIASLERTHAELQSLEATLGAPVDVTELREPGLGGTCPTCGELHGSADRFCAHCGQDLR